MSKRSNKAPGQNIRQKPSEKQLRQRETIKPFQFKPGKSGNPGGRPKKTPLTEALQRIVQDPQAADKLAKSIVKEANKGNHKAFKEIADRVEGKVANRVAFTGYDGEEIKATVNAKLSVGDLVGALRTIYGLANTEGAAPVLPVPDGVGERSKPPQDNPKK